MRGRRVASPRGLRARVEGAGDVAACCEEGPPTHTPSQFEGTTDMEDHSPSSSPSQPKSWTGPQSVVLRRSLLERSPSCRQGKVAPQPHTVEARCKADWPARRRPTEGERATATVVLKGSRAFLGGRRVALPRRPGARVDSESVGDVRPLPSCCKAPRTLRRGLGDIDILRTQLLVVVVGPEARGKGSWMRYRENPRHRSTSYGSRYPRG